jgi:hypothetical protein
MINKPPDFNNNIENEHTNLSYKANDLKTDEFLLDDLSTFTCDLSDLKTNDLTQNNIYEQSVTFRANTGYNNYETSYNNQSSLYETRPYYSQHTNNKTNNSNIYNLGYNGYNNNESNNMLHDDSKESLIHHLLLD